MALDGAAARTRGGVCRQEDLDLGLRKDDRSDVPSFGDDVCVLGGGALKLNHGSPDLGDRCDGRHVLVDLRRPDGLRSIGSVDEDDGTLRAVFEGDLDTVGKVCDSGGIGHVDAAGKGGVGNGAGIVACVIYLCFFAFFRANTAGVAQATFGTYYISLVALPVIVAAMGVSYYLGAKKIERQYQRIRENQRRIYGEDK